MRRLNIPKKIIVDDSEIPENNIFKIQVESIRDDNRLFLPIDVTPNILESVIVLLTSKEIGTDRFSFFIKNMIETLTVHKDVNLLFFLNNSEYTPSNIFNNYITELKRFFKNVYIIDTKIPKKFDIYSLSPLGYMPKYGYVSGPNLLFLNAMEYCKRFNTVLLLETDCILRPNWLDKCVNYVEHSGTFLISGSTYDGCADIPLNFKNMEHFIHINGVAFYNTRALVFHQLMKELDSYLIKYANEVHGVNAYDVVISHMVLQNLKTKNNFKFWRYVFRNMTKNTLILNCSTPVDKLGVKEEKMYQLFPSCVILHKKL